MNKFRFLIITFLIPITYHLSSNGYAQVGIGVEFTPGSSVQKKEEKIIKKGKNPLIVELAERFSVEEKELNKLHKRGYGYLELVKLLLISKKANKPLEEIVKKRDKGKKISKLAEEYELKYREIHLEAQKIREEIEDSSKTIPPKEINSSLEKSTTESLETEENKPGKE